MNAPDRRAQRLEQVQRLTDEEFVSEVRRNQRLRWRSTNLEAHARKHCRDFMLLLGRVLLPVELDGTSHDVLRSWDRLFTELRPDGSVTYDFVRLIRDDDTAIIVVTRGGLIRTTFPTTSLKLRLGRKPFLVEVTDRANRLDLAH